MQKMYGNNQFSIATSESLRCYVYILIDPRNNKIFYVGKGTGNRVFAHVNDSVETEHESDKLNMIRVIRSQGLEVKQYIVRHGLDEDDALTVESTLIDFLTFPDFSDLATITNKVSGHHQWDKGIKTIEEIEILYACEKLKEEDLHHNLMSININKTYDRMLENRNLYEATRKYWVASLQSVEKVDFVLSEYRGIVRGIFKPIQWHKDGKRIFFDGYEVTDPDILSLYLNKALPDKVQGMANPIRYFNKKQVP